MSVPDLPGVVTADDVLATADSIAAVQLTSGAIPWFAGAEVDPWDHVEAAMALDVAGRADRAEAAYDWMRRVQRPDGAWASRYTAAGVADPTTETNHAAYLAVGCWHHWLSTGDEAFLTRMWPAVRQAIEFVLAQQTATGEIWWAVGPSGAGDPVALLTGCASMHQSLRCAAAIADRLERPQPDWELAADRLGHAVRHHPAAFADKDRFSMDWYYPVLGGALRGDPARARLRLRWDEFVVPGKGARCVADRPWVTGAETCELALALDAVQERSAAIELVAAMQHLREEDGSYWTGLVLADGVRWPVERSTWTAAAVVLAVDALHGAHPRGGIFRDAGSPGHGTFDAACADQLCGAS